VPLLPSDYQPMKSFDDPVVLVPVVKNGFGDLWGRGKSPKLLSLKANPLAGLSMPSWHRYA
jgi:hypothetical protein